MGGSQGASSYLVPGRSEQLCHCFLPTHKIYRLHLPSANHVQIFARPSLCTSTSPRTNQCNVGYKSLHSVTLTLSKDWLTAIDHSLTALEVWARSHQLFHFTPNKLSSTQVHCESSFFLAWGRSLVVSHSNSWGLSFRLSRWWGWGGWFLWC